MFPLASPFRLSNASGSTSKRRAMQYGNSPLLSVHSVGRGPTGAEVGRAMVAVVDVPAGLVAARDVGVTVALKSCVLTEIVWVAMACGVPDAAEAARAVPVPKLATSFICVAIGVKKALVALVGVVAGAVE